MSTGEARSYFDGALNEIFTGINTTAFQVILSGWDGANVVVRISDSESFDSFTVRGVAWYYDGRIVGEQHVQPASSVESINGHQHQADHCADFAQTKAGVFIPREAEDTVDVHPYRRLAGAAGLMLGCAVLREMVASGSAQDAFSDDHSGPLRLAARLRGQGETHELFTDPALQAALDQRLASQGLWQAPSVAT